MGSDINLRNATQIKLGEIVSQFRFIFFAPKKYSQIQMHETWIVKCC